MDGNTPVWVSIGILRTQPAAAGSIPLKKAQGRRRALTLAPHTPGRAGQMPSQRRYQPPSRLHSAGTAFTAQVLKTELSCICSTVLTRKTQSLSED